jgi:phosphoglycerol transferase MdoB-like AlkP superfamily enzyme
LAHAFMIGYQATSVPVLIVLALAVVCVAALHVFLFFKIKRPRALQVITITYMVLFLVAALNYGLTQHLGYDVLLKGHGGQSEKR